MKTLVVLNPEKLTDEEIAALRRIGFSVPTSYSDVKQMLSAAEARLNRAFGQPFEMINWGSH
jgi:hypothetical protein